MTREEGTSDLCYFRDLEQREVDFVITEDRKPIILIECKATSRDLSKPLRYLKGRFPAAKAYQLVLRGANEHVIPDGIAVCSTLAFLQDLI